MSETNRIEYKRELTIDLDIEKEVIAFLNYHEEFFHGFSVPRNKELMRIFKDLGMVEQLGSGVPRILESYDRECFTFSDHFLRMTFPVQESMIPQVTPQVIPQVTPQVQKLISIMGGEMTRQELQVCLKLSDRMNFLKNYLQPAIEFKVIEMTIPDKPKSSKQRYRLTSEGEELKKKK